MTKPPSRRGKETVPVPTKKELSDAGKELRKGHSSAGRVLAEKSATIPDKKAARNSAPPPPKPKK
jgi:hypothetical protein